MFRRNAQPTLAHVSLHDALDPAGLRLDKANQVSASEMAGHQKFEIRLERTPASLAGGNGRARVHITTPPAHAAFLAVFKKTLVDSRLSLPQGHPISAVLF